MKRDGFKFFVVSVIATLGLLLGSITSQSVAWAELGCERYLVQSDPRVTSRPIEAIEDLKVGTYNVENLFLHLGKFRVAPDGGVERVLKQRKKPEVKVRRMAEAILDMDLDIVALEEVENIEALEQVNTQYLGGKYIPVLVEGNDPRGIDVAFLIKKDLPFDIQNHSFKNEMWTDPRLPSQGPTKIFSRDLPALVVRTRGAPADSKPLFVFIGTHFKSKRDFVEPNALMPDPESRILRAAQVERAAEIVQRYRQEYGQDLPIMMAGDFNGVVNQEAEFIPLRHKAGLEDAFNLSQSPVPPQDRVTHVYFPDRFRPLVSERNQIDAVFVSPELAGSIVKAEVYRYKRLDGGPYPIPRMKRYRDKQPSDHFPVMVTIKFKALRDRIPQTKP